MSDQDRITQFSILYEIASMPTRLVGLQPIGEAVVDKATRLLGTDLAVLYLCSADRISLQAVAARGVRLNRAADISLSDSDHALLSTIHAGRVFTWSNPVQAPTISPPLKVNYPVQEAVYIPVGQGDHFLGLIYVARLTAKQFTPEELSFFTILADKTATALDNHFLFDETQSQLAAIKKQRAQLEISNQVGQQIASILNLEELLTQVVRSIQLQFNYYHVGVWLPSEETDSMLAYALVDRNREPYLLPGYHIPLDSPQSIIVQVHQSGTFYFAHDVNTDPLYLPFDRMPHTRSEIAMPLRIGQEKLGVLDIHSDQSDFFEPEDIALLQTLATQIAVAVRNAQLYKEAQQARQEAEDANKTKSRFLANMSHELRTPLNVILNFTEFVADRLFGEINEKQENALRHVLASSEHLLSLINDVLDMTKIEAGMMNLFIEEVDVNAVLDAVISMGLGLVKDKPVVLDTQIADLPPTFGDRRRLRQVFLNILSNAVKFTKAGTITLSAEYDSSAHEIEVMVRDTGIGIAEEDHHKVFESFKQAKHDLTGTVGTGLGMPISKHFIEMHQGRIWFDSKLDMGTTFYVRLPVLSHNQADGVNQSQNQ